MERADETIIDRCEQVARPCTFESVRGFRFSWTFTVPTFWLNFRFIALQLLLSVFICLISITEL